jgi:uncharacterized protein YdeI (YjbR/CyaY-like superfamily)
MGPIVLGRPAPGPKTAERDAIALPVELVEALSLYPTARVFFTRLHASAQRQYADYVGQGRSGRDRLHRAWQALELLAARGTFP